MRTGNPMLSDKAFQGHSISKGVMTLQGTINKTLLLLFITIGLAGYIALRFAEPIQEGNQYAMSSLTTFTTIGVIIGLIAALVTIFKARWAPFTAPLYAVAEGAVVGSASLLFELKYPGIVSQAIILTFGIAFAVLFAYKTGLIKATENFKLMIFAATAGIALVYLLSFVLSFFSISIPMIHDSGWMGIGFSLFVVAIAALNLVLDFDFIENAVENKAPDYMEWYGAFGILVTLIWLYFEILRLLAKLRE